MAINLAPVITTVPWQPSVSSWEGYRGNPSSGATGSRTGMSGPTAPETEPREDEARASQSSSSAGSTTAEASLSEEEIKLLEELKNADREVRQHEMAHIAAGGRYVTSGAKLEYQRGPDGQNYAVAGEVSIDTSAIPGDPRATAEKMRVIQQAALAPASPSSQDRKVAARAASAATKAMAELMTLQAQERAASVVSNSAETGTTVSNAYARASEATATPGTLVNISA